MRCSILVVLFCLFSISVRSNVTYEVRPDGKGLQSLIGAKEEIEVRLKNGEIEDYTVILDEGVYYLEHPLVFSENYSLPNGSVTFTGKSGEVPVISGGNDDLSWEYYEHMAGVVKANVDINVRNLWIGGKRMRRAQGYVGYALGIFNEMVDGVDLKGLLFSKEDFPSFTDISGLEIKYYNRWRSYYFKHDINSVSTIPENQVLVVIDNFDVALTQIPDMNWIGVGQKNPYFFENALEFLDEPGEFCYTPSDQTLYYCLKDDESPNNIDAVIPNLQNIISVKSNDKVVENLFFQGLEFSHCDWTWTSQNGFIPLQSSVYFTGTEKWDGFITAAIQVEDARSVKFESCKFTRLSTNGIHIKNNVDGICIENCNFKDLSGAAVSISDPNHRNYSDTVLPVKNILIHNNLVKDIGVEYPSCAAIEAFYAEDVTISHNELYDCPYTGISVGWGWTANPTTTKNVFILNNKIIGDTQKCVDGGGIYTLSHFGGDGCLIQGNYIDETDKCSDPNQGAIYTDEGSSNIYINNNVVLSERKWFYYNQPGKVDVDTAYVLPENHNNYGGRNSSSGKTEINYYGNGEHIFDLPHELADKIIQNAGIQKKDSDLSEKIDLGVVDSNDFSLRKSLGRLEIIANNKETQSFCVRIFGIDGRMERNITSDIGAIYIDGLQNGMHVVDISSGNEKRIYRVWM